MSPNLRDSYRFRLSGMRRSLFASLLFGAITRLVAQNADTAAVDQLADDFWTWRVKCAPFTGDDVNRVERPGGIRDWSRASIDQRRKHLAGLETRWKKIGSNEANWPIHQQVDYKLVGSALSRVRWELDVNPRWKRDPNFYIEQTLTALAEAHTVPAPYDEARSREILTQIAAARGCPEGNYETKGPARNTGRLMSRGICKLIL